MATPIRNGPQKLPQFQENRRSLPAPKKIKIMAQQAGFPNRLELCCLSIAVDGRFNLLIWGARNECIILGCCHK